MELKDRTIKFRQSVRDLLALADYRLERGEDQMSLSGTSGLMGFLTESESLGEAWLESLEEVPRTRPEDHEDAGLILGLVESAIDVVFQLLPEAQSEETADVLKGMLGVAFVENFIRRVDALREEARTIGEEEAPRKGGPAPVTVLLGCLPSRSESNVVTMGSLIEECCHADFQEGAIVNRILELPPGTLVTVREGDLQLYPQLLRHLEPMVQQIIEGVRR